MLRPPQLRPSSALGSRQAPAWAHLSAYPSASASASASLSPTPPPLPLSSCASFAAALLHCASSALLRCCLARPALCTLQPPLIPAALSQWQGWAASQLPGCSGRWVTADPNPLPPATLAPSRGGLLSLCTPHLQHPPVYTQVDTHTHTAPPLGPFCCRVISAAQASYSPTKALGISKVSLLLLPWLPERTVCFIFLARAGPLERVQLGQALWTGNGESAEEESHSPSPLCRQAHTAPWGLFVSTEEKSLRPATQRMQGAGCRRPAGLLVALERARCGGKWRETDSAMQECRCWNEKSRDSDCSSW